MKMRKKILGAALTLSLGVLLMYPVSASAAQGTDGTEMQVLEPEQLEIQLGADWAGVEFELKTDSGMYPGTIPVGEDGVLRLEIGGSSSYVLTCLSSAVPVPDPEQAPDAAEQVSAETTETGDEATGEETAEPRSENQDPKAEPETGQVAEGSPAAEEENTVAGIPVLHLALFGGGMALAIGSLIAMYVVKRRRAVDADYEEDDEE